MSSVKQVGGTHYETTTGVQHWDLMEEFGVSYLEGVATKYLMRWKRKGGVEDLQKSISYLRKMDGRGTRHRIPHSILCQFLNDNQVPEVETVAIEHVLSDRYGTAASIRFVIGLLDELIADTEAEEEARG